MSAQLAIRGATKRFGGITANEDISLEVPEGRVVGLIGPNGSGKSTLFNSIVGYHPVDGGSIRFEGREITRLRTAEIARLGLIRTFQQTHVFVRMTGLQNMAISSCGRSRQRRASGRRRCSPFAASTASATWWRASSPSASASSWNSRWR